MANPLSKNLHAAMIEENGIDIPYDSTGFKHWLTSSERLSEEEADKHISLIQDANAELWQPGDFELFQILKKWLEKANNTKSVTLRTLNIDFAFSLLDCFILDMQQMQEMPDYEDSSLFRDALNACGKYQTYLRSSLNYVSTNEDTSLPPMNERYDKIPLDKEFSAYLKESKFADSTRYRMLTNLRSLNSAIINTGRGDSNWLQKLADKASNGENIRYARITARRLVHSAMSNIDEDGQITSTDLQGALTSINHYISFLIIIASNAAEKNPLNCKCY